MQVCRPSCKERALGTTFERALAALVFPLCSLFFCLLSFGWQPQSATTKSDSRSRQQTADYRVPTDGRAEEEEGGLETGGAIITKGMGSQKEQKKGTKKSKNWLKIHTKLIILNKKRHLQWSSSQILSKLASSPLLHVIRPFGKVTEFHSQTMKCSLASPTICC